MVSWSCAAPAFVAEPVKYSCGLRQLAVVRKRPWHASLVSRAGRPPIVSENGRGARQGGCILASKLGSSLTGTRSSRSPTITGCGGGGGCGLQAIVPALPCHSAPLALPADGRQRLGTQNVKPAPRTSRHGSAGEPTPPTVQATSGSGAACGGCPPPQPARTMQASAMELCAIEFIGLCRRLTRRAQAAKCRPGTEPARATSGVRFLGNHTQRIVDLAPSGKRMDVKPGGASTASGAG